MKQRVKAVLMIVAIDMLVFGCTNQQSSIVNRNQAEPIVAIEQQISDYIAKLTSEEFAGRMSGTKGNEITGNWLSGMLNDLGIEAFEEEYQIGFPGWSNTYGKSQITIQLADGSERELIQGKDFLISLGEGSFSATLEPDSLNFAMLGSADSFERDAASSNSEIFIFFSYADKFYSTAGHPEIEGKNIVKNIQVSDEIFNILLEGKYMRVNITNEIVYEDKEIYNIAGMIRGLDSDKCVVLSAHFDHIGQAGKQHFPGALDNASGVASLIYIAEQLKATSEQKPFDFDIVIVFFNSEEISTSYNDLNPLGSKCFVPIVAEQYRSIYNINIDCVGQNDGEYYAIGQTGSNELSRIVSEFAVQYGIRCDLNSIYRSDATSFIHAGIPSINFISTDYLDNVHIFSDNLESVNVDQIIRLSDMIVNLLTDIGNDIFDVDTGLHKMEMETVPNTMAEQFKVVLDSARKGVDVSFFDEFYSIFPERNQYIFGYREYQERYDNFSHFNIITDYELRIITDIHDNHRKANLIYFHKDDYDATAFFIIPVDSEQIVRELYEDKVILNLYDSERYSVIASPNPYSNSENDECYINSLLFIDGNSSFNVYLGSISAEVGSTTIRIDHYFYNAMSTEKAKESMEDLIKVSGFLKFFEEFHTMWMMYFA